MLHHSDVKLLQFSHPDFQNETDEDRLHIVNLHFTDTTHHTHYGISGQ